MICISKLNRKAGCENSLPPRYFESGVKVLSLELSSYALREFLKMRKMVRDGKTPPGYIFGDDEILIPFRHANEEGTEYTFSDGEYKAVLHTSPQFETKLNCMVSKIALIQRATLSVCNFNVILSNASTHAGEIIYDMNSFMDSVYINTSSSIKYAVLRK